jgi:predicted GNAT family N-acyltransferase
MKVKHYNELPDESREIRIKVFVDEQGFREEFDTQDNNSIHFLAFADDDTAIGTCRIFRGYSEDEYYLGRLAVVRECRGMNVGRRLIKAAENYVVLVNGRSIKLHSQLHAKGFYEKCGYTAFGEIEPEEGCPHIWMTKKLDIN